MNIDEEINHCEKVAENQEWLAEAYGDDSMGAKLCKECAEEHRQLAKWLRELKRDRELLSGLSVVFESLAMNAAIDQRPITFDMRDATEQERKSVNLYINKICKHVSDFSDLWENDKDDE